MLAAQVMFQKKWQKHLAAAVLYITRHCHIEKKSKTAMAKLHRIFQGQVKSATVSQMPSGKYYVSILVETEHGELPHTNGKTDLDLGIKDLCITSDGNKYENPRTIKKYEKKLTKLQRQLAQTDGLTVRTYREHYDGQGGLLDREDKEGKTLKQ